MHTQGSVLRCAQVIVGLGVLLLIPRLVHTQSSAIAGVVKDPSGAVLPGVTVEAASDVLIEKVRTVVTDGARLYKIDKLRGGRYTVTFTLSGFNTFKREDLELATDFVATVNADMRVGSLQETITVMGESPIVDIQSAKRQRTLDSELIQAIPSARAYNGIVRLIPSMTGGGNDVVLSPGMIVWLNRTSVMTARTVKITGQFDF
jgi:Carboxypeptidase regulatory-like domain